MIPQLRAASLALVLLCLPGLARAAVVKVEGGALAGTEANGIRTWRNIPYAAAPVGPLRWAPPAPVVPWSGERDATRNGVSCIQPMNRDGSPNSGSANGAMSEDCLQLNVFAPANAKKAPVMVWLHGGSHRYGAGWIYDGSNFARDGVILVSLNYRLGPMGYFAHPALTAEAEAGPVGNYGLMDQLAALAWVKRNIAAFGGDPKKVTLFGESAGGASTLAILATPKAKGLFRSAIVQSGGGWSRETGLADREAEGVKTATALGLTNPTAEALRAVPAEALSQAAAGSFGPFVDGKLLPQTPTQAFADGKAIDVPLIIGSNSGEDSLMRELGMAPASGDKAAETAARQAFTDRAFGAPARWIAARASKGRPAWLYHFSYIGSRFRPMGMTRAAHAAEIQYVFEYWGRRTPLSAVAPDDRAMATLMHSCWVAFAKTEIPTCASGPAWPAYGPGPDQLMEFGMSSGVRTQFRKPEFDRLDAMVLPALTRPESVK